MMDKKILIVGAGIAGLSMARRLQQKNIWFEIIDQREKDFSSLSGIALPFNAVRELRNLGFDDLVDHQSHQVREVIYTKSNGDVLTRADLLAPPFENDKFISMKRGDLTRALISGLEDKVHFKIKLENVEQTTEKTSITCSKSDLNGDYDLVIAADGIHSVMRQQAFDGERTDKTHGITCWRFIVDLPKHGLEPTYMFGNTDLFMAYPLGLDSLYCYGHIHDDNRYHSIGENAHENIKRIFGSFGGPVPEILKKIDAIEIVTGPLKSVTTPRFYKHRTVFIGDSSNGCSPLIQQGAAAAFEDAKCLANNLELNDIDASLKRYEAARKPRVDWVVSYSDTPLGQVLKMDKPLIKSVRNLVIKLLGAYNHKGWKKLATDQDVAYRD